MTHPLRRLVFVVFVCVCAWFANPSGQGPIVQPTYVADEVLVRFRPETPRARRDAVIANRGGRVVRRMNELGIDRVAVSSLTPVESAIAAFQRDPEVLDAQPNYIRQIVASPDDPYWADASLWGLQKIQAREAWTITTGSAAVIVANIDTGVNYAHPDLANNMWRNPGEVAANGIDDDRNGYVDDVYGIDAANNDSDPMDDHGHGTDTAGTIGAVGNNATGVVGVNWNVKILPCKAMTASGTGTDADAIECFNYVVALKNRGIDVRVTSNSWGSNRGAMFPSALKAAIDAAGDKGILNVFAAGNSSGNIDTQPFDPASFTSPSIIAVAASDGNDQPAAFSNYGLTSVDLAAPGVGILSTNTSGYGFSSGTSMAAPHVAGAAALVAGFNSTLTMTGIKSSLIGSVDQLPSWTGIVASGGRLNLFKAVLDSGGDIPPSVTLVRPAQSDIFTAPATIALEASATDQDGTVAKVEFFASGTLVGTDTTSPYSVTWSNVQPGSYTVTAVATDNGQVTKASDPVSVAVSAATITSRVNVALAANGGVATASSTYAASHAPSAVINGDRKGAPWGAGGGWNDATATFPDWVRIDFPSAKTINEVDVFSVQDNVMSPVEPTAALTFSRYGITDFQVEYWTGSGWAPIPGGVVSGNRLVWKQVSFSAITTTALRIYITGSMDGWSRLAEVEVYSGDATITPPPPPPPGRINVALAANGGVATASSTYAASHAPSAVINGDRKGAPWGAGGGWNDATATFPDWLRIDFPSAKTINEVDVFSVQDNVMSPVEPTASLTFSRYGITDFQVEYWTGSGWAPIPGGVVSGNRVVWKQVNFSAITTTAVRIYITGSMDGWSRLAEVEVYSGDATITPPPPPAPGRINVALAANGGVATASSTYATSHAPNTAINGDRKGAPWGAGGGWNDATATFPDWLRIDFPSAKTINEVDVFSVQDNVMSPVEPTASLTFSRYGITDFQVEYWTGSGWAPIPGAVVSGNRVVWKQLNFSAITTTTVRIYITGSMDGWSRLAEVEVYSGDATITPPLPPPPAPAPQRINVALASNGGVATASSMYSTSHSPSSTINGERKGSPWGAGGGWNDATPTFPDWLRVDFAGAKTINEISVFSVQDNVMSPSEPTATMTFNRYGLTDFLVEYWTGTSWTAIPGGAVSGNRLVWKQVTFSPVTTTAIRVYITGSMDGWSRMVEVEAYTADGSGTVPSSLIGFPSDNWWNLDISTAPVDPNSAAYINFINNGSTRRLHPDFGGNASPGSIAIYGMPYLIVDSTVPKKAVQFDYSSESDGVNHATNESFPFYPIPDAAITQPYMVEGGEPGNVDRRAYNDRHLLIVDKDKRHLYELWNVFYDGAQWRAGAGAFFDMNTNNRRPEGWTSADAAGLAILPGLVRYEEAYGTEEIRHALRVTVHATNGFVFPASHRAGSMVGALPMGARLRLKPSANISGFSPELQRIFRAMMKYGLIVADNGTDMFISGAYDPKWNNDILNPAFRALTANDFEVISLGYR